LSGFNGFRWRRRPVHTSASSIKTWQWNLVGH